MSQIQAVFTALGSTLNPTLTQLAKTRHVVFVEGKDFQILSLFARSLGLRELANRSDFAIIPIDGFNPKRVKELSQGMEITLGAKVAKAVILDRDYRSTNELESIGEDLAGFAQLVHIHKRKEIENYLINIDALQKAANKKWEDRRNRGFATNLDAPNIEKVLLKLTEDFKNPVLGQFISHRSQLEKLAKAKLDNATIVSKLVAEFESAWDTLEGKFELAPGKDLLAGLNYSLQTSHSLTLSPSDIVKSMQSNDVPIEMRNLLQELDKFRVSSAD